MTKLHEVRTVPRPRDEVFAYTADFSNSSEWDPGVVSSKKVGDNPIGVGSLFDLEVRFGSGTEPMTYEITEHVPSERLVLVGRGEKVEAVDTILFEDDNGVTVVDYTAELTFHNYFKYLGPLLPRLLEPVGTKAMDGLQEVLSR